MNSRVIKFVAGGGKTTFAINYMAKNRNGLYLAFTNSVVDEAKRSGYLSLTFDSLFSSYIIPKLAAHIPLIADGARVEIIKENDPNFITQGARRINIDESGGLSNGSRIISGVTLATPNSALHIMGRFANSQFIKHIFGKESLCLGHLHVEGLANFLIKNYSESIINILKDRFSCIIIDESQDLKGYRESFAQLVYQSEVPIILLGDSNQNVNGGGLWFEDLSPTETKNFSYRCADGVCRWIRENLSVDIQGTNKEGAYINISLNDVPQLDDGIKKLLYRANSGHRIKPVIDNWRGPKGTIQSVKGETIDADIVIVGNTLNRYNLYTAITRTTKSVYSTVTVAQNRS